MRVIFACALTAAILCTCTPLASSATDASLEASVYVGGPAGLTAGAWAPDGSGRLFLANKEGAVYIVQKGVLLSEPFVVIRDIYPEWEVGLLGFAFDFNFETNGYVYFLFSSSATEQKIVRYVARTNQGTDPLFVVARLPGAPMMHNGGGIGFGPDGMLYFSIGDGFVVPTPPTAGDLGSLAGKIGRLQPDGSVPFDNPFVDGDGPNADAIWARGFRNPFRLAFHPVSGELWVNTVGHTFEQIFALRGGEHAGWEQFENDQGDNHVAPVFAYRTNHSTVRDIVAAARRDGISTFTTDWLHYYRPGQKVLLSGVTSTYGFDGAGYVSTVPSPTTFTIEQLGPDDVGSGGAVASEYLGGCITGGTFYDSSIGPLDYRGDYFFTDYNAGTLNRVDLDEAGRVRSVDPVVSDIASPVDLTLGADGAFYAISYSGLVHRIVQRNDEAQLVVTPLNVRMAENGLAVFEVRLSRMPESDVRVNIRRAWGDADVSIAQGTALVFTAADWFRTQPVRLAAAPDADALEDVAIIDVEAAGLATESVVVRVTDAVTRSVVASHAALTLAEGSSAALGVRLSSKPAGDTLVSIRVEGDGDVAVRPQILTFGAADWSVFQEIQVDAGHDADYAEDSATLSLEADGWTTRRVAIQVDDDDDRPPEFTSTPVTTAVVNAPYSYLVRALGLPPPVLELATTIGGMELDTATSILSWVPTANGTWDVTLRAYNGVAPEAVQSFALTVKADEPPDCSLTKPAEGETISGSATEFFGDGADDAATVWAAFLVDGVEYWLDVGESGHYHFGGAHNRFDTTGLANGEHVLRMVVADSAGQTCFVDRMVVVDNAPNVDAGGQVVEPGANDAGASDASSDAAAAHPTAPADGGDERDAGDAMEIDASDATSRGGANAGGGSWDSGSPAPGAPDLQARGGCECQAVSGRSGGALAGGAWVALLAAAAQSSRRMRRRRGACP